MNIPPHRGGHILDLILSGSSEHLKVFIILLGGTLSDKPHKDQEELISSKIKDIDLSAFKSDI